MVLLQVISADDTILRCLFDFSGQEGDELTIQANQVSGCFVLVALNAVKKHGRSSVRKPTNVQFHFVKRMKVIKPFFLLSLFL